MLFLKRLSHQHTDLLDGCTVTHTHIHTPNQIMYYIRNTGTREVTEGQGTVKCQREREMERERARDGAKGRLTLVEVAGQCFSTGGS